MAQNALEYEVCKFNLITMAKKMNYVARSNYNEACKDTSNCRDKLRYGQYS